MQIIGVGQTRNLRPFSGSFRENERKGGRDVPLYGMPLYGEFASRWYDWFSTRVDAMVDKMRLSRIEACPSVSFTRLSQLSDLSARPSFKVSWN